MGEFMSNTRELDFYKEIESGDSKTIDYIISKRINDRFKNPEDYIQYPPVSIAIRNNKLDVLNKLIEYKANIEISDNYYDYTPLAWALCAFGLKKVNSINMVQKLIDSGANIQHESVTREITAHYNDLLCKRLITALRQFRDSKQNDSQKGIHALELARLYKELNLPNEELRFYQESVSMQNLEAMLEVGQKYINDHNYNSAISLLKQVYHKNKSGFAELEKLGQLEAKENKISLQNKFELNALLLEEYLKVDNKTKALPLLMSTKKLLSMNELQKEAMPTDIIQALQLLSDDQPQVDVAFTLIKNLRLLKTSPNDNYNIQIAKCYIALNKMDLAEPYFKEALKRNSTLENVLEYAKFLMAHKKNDLEAIKIVENGFNQLEKKSENFRALGDLLTQIVKTNEQANLKEIKENNSGENHLAFNAAILLCRIKLAEGQENIFKYYTDAKQIAEKNKLRLTIVQQKMFEAVETFGSTFYNNLYQFDDSHSIKHIDAFKLLEEAYRCGCKELSELFSKFIKMIDCSIVGKLITGSAIDARYKTFSDGIKELYGLNNQRMMPERAIKTFERAAEEKDVDSNTLAHIYSNIAYSNCILAHRAYVDKDPVEVKNRINKAILAFNQASERTVYLYVIAALNYQFNLLKIADKEDKMIIIKSICAHYKKHIFANGYANKMAEFLDGLILKDLDFDASKMVINLLNDSYAETKLQTVKSMIKDQLIRFVQDSKLSEKVRYLAELALSDCHARENNNKSLLEAKNHYEKAVALAKRNDITCENRSNIYVGYASCVLDPSLQIEEKNPVDAAILSCGIALNQALAVKDEKATFTAIEHLIKIKSTNSLSLAQENKIEKIGDGVFDYLLNLKFYSQNVQQSKKLFEYAKEIYSTYATKFKGYITHTANEMIDSVILSQPIDKVIPLLLQKYLEFAGKKEELVIETIFERIRKFILAQTTKSINIIFHFNISNESAVIFKKILNQTVSLLEKYEATLEGSEKRAALLKLAAINFCLMKPSCNILKVDDKEREAVLDKQINYYSKLSQSKISDEHLSVIIKNLESIVESEKFPSIVKKAEAVLSVILYNINSNNKQNLKLAAKCHHLPAVVDLIRINSLQFNWLLRERKSRLLYLNAKAFLLASLQFSTRETKRIMKDAQNYIMNVEGNILSPWLFDLIKRQLSTSETEFLKKDPEAFLFYHLKIFCKSDPESYEPLKSKFSNAIEKALLGETNLKGGSWIHEKIQLAEKFALESLEQKEVQQNSQVETGVEEQQIVAPVYYYSQSEFVSSTTTSTSSTSQVVKTLSENKEEKPIEPIPKASAPVIKHETSEVWDFPAVPSHPIRAQTSVTETAADHKEAKLVIA